MIRSEAIGFAELGLLWFCCDCPLDDLISFFDFFILDLILLCYNGLFVYSFSYLDDIFASFPYFKVMISSLGLSFDKTMLIVFYDS